jgi:beta-xylosidase
MFFRLCHSVLILLAAILNMACSAPLQETEGVDDGNTFKNPIIFADYSDPDVIRVGDDFYMTASSFNAIPGLPILHSKDMVHWRLIGHVIDRLEPEAHFASPRHGGGVWAPSIRHHKGEFYIYYGDPDFGIYLVKSTNPEGPWDKPVLVEAGKGLIDPSPLWDDDGKAYLVHAYAGSRAGIKSILVVKPLNAEGTKTLGPGKIIFDGHAEHPTVEGPKFYKRNGWYYVLAPAGGVKTGWQLALRSKNPFGPYEEKIVLEQGSTHINGPHQGAWVSLANGDDWFFHFQDRGLYGRIVHLQVMRWENDWPIMGIDYDGNGIGEPALEYPMPKTSTQSKQFTLANSDEFDEAELGLQWQWHGNYQATWAFINPSKNQLRLYSQLAKAEFRNFWDIPHLLLQKFPAEAFEVETKVAFSLNTGLNHEQAGLVVMGADYAHISFFWDGKSLSLVLGTCQNAENGNPEKWEVLAENVPNELILKVKVESGGACVFAYSVNGTDFMEVPAVFQAKEGKWIGAKVGIYALRNAQTNDAGFADFDWFRIKK